MAISPITQNTPQRKKHNYVKITGWTATGLGTASVIAAKTKGLKHKMKLHKNLAYLAGIFTLAHIAILESYKFKKK